MINYAERVLPLAVNACATADALMTTICIMAKHEMLTPDNVLLLQHQMPNATALGGYNAWQQHYHRTVKPDAQPILLLRPYVYVDMDNIYQTDENGDPIADDKGQTHTVTTPVERAGYVPVRIYDISQTETNDDSLEVDEAYRLTAADVINGFRKVTDCEVQSNGNSQSASVLYNKEENCLYVLTEDKNVVAKECIKILAKRESERTVDPANKSYAALISECAAAAVARSCNLPETVLSNKIISYAAWRGDKRNSEECLELLNQIYRAARRVMTSLRDATNHPMIFDFDETGLVNEALTDRQAEKAIARITIMMSHTNIPILVDSGVSLAHKLELVSQRQMMEQLYDDRCNKRILSQPPYQLNSKSENIDSNG